MSNNLDLDQLTTGQNNKETTINDANAQLDAALTNEVDIDTTGASSPVTVSTDDSVRRMVLKFTGTHPGGTLRYNVPSNKKLYVVRNTTSDAIQVGISGGSAVSVAAGQRQVLYADGTDIVDLAGTSGGSLSIKQAVRVATTAAGTLSSDFDNGKTVDGVTLSTGDRILIKDQSSGDENGIYVVEASGTPTRASDLDEDSDVQRGVLVAVMEGTTNAKTLWTLTTAGPYTLGSTSLTFEQISGSGGGVTNIDDLGDVNIYLVDDFHMLRYDSGTGEWINEAIPYDLSMYLPGTRGDGERVAQIIFDRAVDFPINLAGSQGYAAIVPAGDDQWLIKKNGSQIGTIDFTYDSNSVSFTFSSAVSFAAGDRLEITSDYPSDDTLADVSLTFLGFRKG